MDDPGDGRRYIEDFEVGQTQTYGAYTLSADEIVSFAEQFDPQPMHTDEAAAAETRYGGLIASGWHTASIAMRLAVLEGYLQDLAVVAGVGIEHLRWTAPVRPGDTLSVREEIVEVGPSASDPSQGLLHIEIVVLNQEGDQVMSMVWIDLVERREPRTG